MCAWAEQESGLMQTEKIVALPARADEHMVRHANNLAQLMWMAWLRSEGAEFARVEIRLRVLTANEAMFAEARRKDGALLVFVEDRQFPFLLCEPSFSSRLEGTEALDGMEKRLVASCEFVCLAVDRYEDGCSRHGLPLVIFTADPVAMQCLEEE